MADKNRQPMKAMALMTTITSYLAGAIVVGVFLGKWIDSKIGTFPLFLIMGLLLGLGAGMYGTIRAVQQFYAGEK